MSEANLNELKRIFEDELRRSLQRPTEENEFSSKRLDESMRYALLSPGKRLRPLLVLASAIAFDKSRSQAIKHSLPMALSVEYIHTYSLIHDDLPAMDNDDMRRGRPTLHRLFDEGLAILAGDALLADAFYFASLAKYNAISICRELALTTGSRGLASGQSEDLNRQEKKLTDWYRINNAKTARLFEACTVMGALSVDAKDTDIATMRKLGRAFGTAYQIKDDLEDEAGLFEQGCRRELESMLEENIQQAHLLGQGFNHPEILFELLKVTYG